jgi:hypothetical protein
MVYIDISIFRCASGRRSGVSLASALPGKSMPEDGTLFSLPQGKGSIQMNSLPMMHLISQEICRVG